ARANDPLLLFRELGTLGQLEVRTHLEDIPPLADFEPFGVYCSWELTLISATAGEAQIAEVFEFVDGNCDLEIVSVGPAEQAVPVEPPMPSFAELAGIELSEDGLDAA